MGLTEASAFKDSSIGTADIADNAVTTAKIADTNITTAKIADGAVTQAKINSAVIFTPVGTVITYAGASAPTGYLKSNGDTIPDGSGTVQGVTADFSALYAIVGATLPDLRGEFVRGFDDGKGTDSGRAIRSTQTDQNKQHNHSATSTSSVTDSGHTHTANFGQGNLVSSGGAFGLRDSPVFKRPIWTTGSLPRAAWQDSAVFNKPHSTYYNPDSNTSYDVIGNTDGCTIYYEQETGTDQVDAGGVTTAVLGSITSGDFDITQKRASTGAVVGMPDIRGDGEYIMRISRFIPDFITQTGSTRVSFTTRTYPNSSSTTSNFDVTSSTTKKDTRIRARSIALKVSNTAASQDWKLGTFRLDIHPGGRR